METIRFELYAGMRLADMLRTDGKKTWYGDVPVEGWFGLYFL